MSYNNCDSKNHANIITLLKKIVLVSVIYFDILFWKEKTEMTTRIHLHLICMIRRPKNWRFYWAGIKREIFP
jgi:hypothetical protein